MNQIAQPEDPPSDAEKAVFTNAHAATTLQLKCTIDHARCHSGPLEDWFKVILCNTQNNIACDNIEQYFCPRHALAAEVLIALGVTALQVISIIRAYEHDA